MSWFMRDGEDSLFGSLNQRKWLPPPLWDYKWDCQVGLSEPTVVVLYDDASIALTPVVCCQV